MVNKQKNKIFIFLRNIIFLLTVLFLVLFLSHQLITFYEKDKYTPPGRLVEVNGKNMHIYTKGDGKDTIVLLSGLGTAAPHLDFAPLINDLAKNHKVVAVEIFGYGFSDLTNEGRTVENIVKEIRMGLKKAGIEGPYTLMPHSISGVYSMYYANKYPEEVKAIIGIDPTLPLSFEYFNESVPTMPGYMQYAAPSGIARLIISINQKDYLPIAEAGTYSEENIQKTKAISSWRGYNRNIVEEMKLISYNLDQTKEMTFPDDKPVIIFTANDMESDEDARARKDFYQLHLNNNPASEVIILEGHHYLHWTRYKEISKKVFSLTKDPETE
ncbi:Pimeloyl-ACP methyl ester carboxylesterase [Gracilibacillus ureilyticus]|uniref:Pimeloyl-ACP methyl ester carboxylesterase n=1 Tax=Gracilibacillus ureilyticus TaxID=531814 RepID=A0A1H9Q7Y5_9BACI|nr:alpha/beta hydrolase [Gracilibacillus ureilyticus]SER56550.1 Pimeloyl-ACP methyl ester carboxylesterase [Gracilibacillus ureilyticus]